MPDFSLSLPALALYYLLFINLFAFILMGLDKRKAKRGAWRIPERTLFLPVLLGGGVKIMDSDAHSLDYEKRGKGHQIDIPMTKPVTIGDDVFVGANAMILKGVTIGQRAIIGAGSVVTKNVPAGEIWAGNPARKIGNAPEHG